MANWRPSAKCRDDGVMGVFTRNIEAREAIDKDLLPDLRSDSELVLVSDYGGEHKESRVEVLAYLIADRRGILRRWDIERRQIRKKFLRDQRRISFKGLGDGKKQKALVPFLNSANTINGLLLCVAIDKSVPPFADTIEWPTGKPPEEMGKSFWKPHVWEKLVRVSLFGSVVVGGLCRSGQSLHWITDEDNIVANEECQMRAGLVQRQ